MLGGAAVQWAAAGTWEGGGDQSRRGVWGELQVVGAGLWKEGSGVAEGQTVRVGAGRSGVGLGGGAADRGWR